MHNIFDLKEMDMERLHSLASELEIKGYKRLEKDVLVYAILDKEAERNAKNAPERPEKPRRGRPKKSDKPSAKETTAPVETDKNSGKDTSKGESSSDKKSLILSLLFGVEYANKENNELVLDELSKHSCIAEITQ